MGKIEADHLLKIDMRYLRESGFLVGYVPKTLSWTSGFDERKSSVWIAVSTMDNPIYCRLKYTQTNFDGEKRAFDYKISLTTTRCNFGGMRYWFLCPLTRNGVYCGRRIGVLYSGGDYFGCRHCFDLTYHSRNENHRNRFSRLARAVSEEEKIEQIAMQIKRPYYAGKPTRKQRRLEAMQDKYGDYCTLLQRLKIL